MVLWEFGNEINAFLLEYGLSLTAGEYADDLGRMRDLVDEADPGIFLAASGGTFLYVGAADLLPEGQASGRRRNTLAFLLGVAVMILYGLVFWIFTSSFCHRFHVSMIAITISIKYTSPWLRDNC